MGIERDSENIGLLAAEARFQLWPELWGSLASLLRSYTAAHGRDLSAELTLYVVHGWLHLAGHDALAPAPRRAMRRAEARALALLRAAGAIPHFTTRPLPKIRAIRRVPG